MRSSGAPAGLARGTAAEPEPQGRGPERDISSSNYLSARAFSRVRQGPGVIGAHILPTSSSEALPLIRAKGPLTCIYMSSGGTSDKCERRLRGCASPQVSRACMGTCTPPVVVILRSKHSARTLGDRKGGSTVALLRARPAPSGRRRRLTTSAAVRRDAPFLQGCRVAGKSAARSSPTRAASCVCGARRHKAAAVQLVAAGTALRSFNSSAAQDRSVSRTPLGDRNCRLGSLGKGPERLRPAEHEGSRTCRPRRRGCHPRREPRHWSSDGCPAAPQVQGVGVGVPQVTAGRVQPLRHRGRCDPRACLPVRA